VINNNAMDEFYTLEITKRRRCKV